MLLASFSLLAACQQRPPAESATLPATVQTPGAIYATDSARALTPEQLVAELSRHQRVIVGEEHTNGDHHLIEQWLVEKLSAARPQGSVLMEMITPDQQPAVTEVQQALQSGTPLRAGAVAHRINWQTGWPWLQYRGVVMSAITRPAPLLAANLNRAEVSQFWQQPRLPDGKRSGTAEVRNTISTLITVMHGGEIEPEQLTPMLAIQQQRDRRMAQSLLTATPPALLFAGGIHAAKNLGVPLHVGDLDPAADVVVLMLVRGGERVSPAVADYVWTTPEQQ